MKAVWGHSQSIFSINSKMSKKCSPLQHTQNKSYERWSFRRRIENNKIWRNFSVKKGTLPLRWVSSPGPFDCRSNALSSDLRRFQNFSHRNLLTPIWLRINRGLFSDFSKSFQSIMSIIRRVYSRVSLSRTVIHSSNDRHNRLKWFRKIRK